MMWGLGGTGFLWMALFWIGLILLVVWIVRQLSPAERPHRAMDILEERFARGEIDGTEFETRRRELTR